MKVGKVFLLVAVLVVCSEEAYSQRGYLKAEKMGVVCDEIGMSGQAPAGCMLQTKIYKGATCYRCRPEEKCNPECRGGKMCVDKRCICPSNWGLVDCNGVCVNGLQCKGLATPREKNSNYAPMVRRR